MSKIMVAEDDPAIRALITQVLSLEGHTVTSFAEGGTALSALRSAATPDLAVLDIMMPGVDGLTLLQEIRGSQSTQTTPVVLLTAKTDDATTWAGWSGGCDYYMTKPFEPEDLVTAVNRLLSKAAS